VTSEAQPLHSQPQLEQVLGSYLAVRELPDAPPLRLWLVASHIDLNARCAELLAGGYAPYWAFCWGAGQALAHYILEHPESVHGQRVADFGAGSGVVAIAAALAGASRVVAVDIDPKARHFAKLNAELNGAHIEVSADMPAEYDLLLASDVFYDSEATRIVRELIAGGRSALIGDAGRPGSYRPAEPPLAWVPSRTFPDVEYPIASAAIYRFG
jgi:predicted nicotinamide N-methyase